MCPVGTEKWDSSQTFKSGWGRGVDSRLASLNTGSTSHREGEFIAHFLDEQSESQKSHSQVGQKHLTGAAKPCPGDISLAPVDA